MESFVRADVLADWTQMDVSNDKLELGS